MAKYYRYCIKGVKKNIFTGKMEPKKTTDKFIYSTSRSDAMQAIIAKYGFDTVIKEYGGSDVAHLYLTSKRKSNRKKHK